MTSDVHEPEVDAGPAVSSDRGLRVALLIVISVAVVVAAGAVGFLVRGSGGSTSPTPSATSVDAGFARDMSTHHEQAVSMAVTAYANSSDASVKSLAFDIQSSQQFQIGQMNGWLDSWGLSRQSSVPMMSWMSGDMGHMHMSTDSNDGALMPGMATSDQMSTLRSATGKAMDVLFLQLMLRHHQGGVEMAQYAAAHAQEPYVRALAQKMVTVQGYEITEMQKMLSARGATPLPHP